MARGYTTRKLEVWSMHAHADTGDVDYRELFRDLRTLAPRDRTYRTDDKLVAIPVIRVFRSGAVLIQAYEGPPDVQPLIYDAAEGTERLAPVEQGEIVATKTHALFDVESREAIIEYNHRGAKAQDIATVLGTAARRRPRWRGLFFELAPQVDRGFVDEIDRFERIRLASMRLTRPNIDWTDFSDDFASFAEDSEAQSGQIEMNARRGKSLSKSRGIVAALRSVVTAERSTIKNAVVRGVREGEQAETSVTLNDFKTHQKVSARMDPNGHVVDDDIERKLRAFRDARRSQEE